jgi:hypothetical protein
MEQKDFLEQLEKETSFIGAEKLASKFSHTIIKSEWRISYSTIKSDYLKAFGWKVLGLNRNKDNEDFIFNLGFIKCFDFFINKEKKQMVKFSEYGRELPYINILNGLSNTPPPSYIITLEEYKQILIIETGWLLQKREDIKTLVCGLIDNYKSEIEQMNNKVIEQQIIEEALEVARKKGLIPSNIVNTDFNF